MRKITLFFILNCFIFGCASPQTKNVDVAKEVQTEIATSDPVIMAPSKEYREDIRARIGAGLPKLQTCYTTLLKTEKMAQGKLVLMWVIQASGDVKDVQIRETDQLKSPAFRTCISKLIQSWKFQSWKANDGMMEAMVSYPFIFNSK